MDDYRRRSVADKATSSALRFGFPAGVFAVVGFVINSTTGLAVAIALSLLVSPVVGFTIAAVAQFVLLMALNTMLFPCLKNHWVVRERGTMVMLTATSLGYLLGGSVPWLIVLLGVFGNK